MTRLKKERLKEGLTQLEVSDAASVAEKQVSCIERGFMVSKPAFKRLCEFFNLDPEEALEDVEEEVA